MPERQKYLYFYLEPQFLQNHLRANPISFVPERFHIVAHRKITAPGTFLRIYFSAFTLVIAYNETGSRVELSDSRSGVGL